MLLSFPQEERKGAFCYILIGNEKILSRGCIVIYPMSSRGPAGRRGPAAAEIVTVTSHSDSESVLN